MAEEWKIEIDFFFNAAHFGFTLFDWKDFHFYLAQKVNFKKYFANLLTIKFGDRYKNV